MTRSRIGLAVTCAVALAVALAGCREEEQHRVLMFDKGSYAGKPDTPLSEANLAAMRDRMRHQRESSSFAGPGAGYGSGSGAGHGAPSAPDVRPPGASIKALRSRGQNQRFN